MVGEGNSTFLYTHYDYHLKMRCPVVLTFFMYG